MRRPQKPQATLPAPSSSWPVRLRLDSVQTEPGRCFASRRPFRVAERDPRSSSACCWQCVTVTPVVPPAPVMGTWVASRSRPLPRAAQSVLESAFCGRSHVSRVLPERGTAGRGDRCVWLLSRCPPAPRAVPAVPSSGGPTSGISTLGALVVRRPGGHEPPLLVGNRPPPWLESAPPRWVKKLCTFHRPVLNLFQSRNEHFLNWL